MQERINTPVDSSLIFAAEDALINLHQLLGQSWTVDVVLVTMALKMCMTLPLNVWREKQINKRSLVELQLHDLKARRLIDLKPQVQSGLLTKYKAWTLLRTEMDKEKERLIKKYNCHTGRRVISIFAEISAYITYFFTLRNLTCVYPQSVVMASHEMSTQGVLWFENLLVPDAYYVLPVAVGAVMLFNSEVSARVVGG